MLIFEHHLAMQEKKKGKKKKIKIVWAFYLFFFTISRSTFLPGLKTVLGPRIRLLR